MVFHPEKKTVLQLINRKPGKTVTTADRLRSLAGGMHAAALNSEDQIKIKTLIEAYTANRRDTDFFVQAVKIFLEASEDMKRAMMAANMYAAFLAFFVGKGKGSSPDGKPALPGTDSTGQKPKKPGKPKRP